MLPSSAQPTPERPIARYLGLLQFFFVLTWTVYAAYLPALLGEAGIGKDKAGWVLLADQILFALFDVAAGFLADRAFRHYVHLGPWLLGLTTLSCLAFLLLPHAADWDHAPWRAPLFLSLTAIWAISSSALRAPAFAMFSRHLPPAATPRLATGLLAGMAFAGIISPYLGTVLKTLDPHLPFALSSLTLLAAACGLIRAEKAAQTIKAPAPAPSTTPLRMTSFYPLLVLAALAFQIAFNLEAAPAYLEYTIAANLAWLMPVFWIGFNVAALARKPLTNGLKDNARLFGLGCTLAAVGAALGGALAAVILGQFLAGLGWGIAMTAAFGLASECGWQHRMATATGLLFAALALATLARIGVNLAGLSQTPEWKSRLDVLPFFLWSGVGLAAMGTARSRKT